MAEPTSDLWGDGIDVDDLSPVMILNTQAAILKKRSKGIIQAEVTKRSSENINELFFDLVSQISGHRSRILACRYAKDFVYPSYLTSQALRFTEGGNVHFVPPEIRVEDEQTFPDQTRIAWRQDDLTRILAEIFQSNEVRAKISSMLALSNEAKQPLEHLVDHPTN